MPYSAIFLHGSSAGAAGAYHLSAALGRLGVKLNGALLDSYIITTRHPDLFAAKCTTQSQIDPSYDMAQAALKVGAFLQDESLFFENNYPGPYTMPTLVLDGSNDDQCCGALPPIEAASAAGFSNNCTYTYDPLVKALAAMKDPDLYRMVVVEGGGHVVGDQAPAQAAIAEWIGKVTAAGLTKPVFGP